MNLRTLGYAVFKRGNIHPSPLPHPHLVIKVRAGRKSGRAYVSDDVSSFNNVAVADGELVEVGISSSIPFVNHPYVVSARPTHGGDDDFPRVCGNHGNAPSGGRVCNSVAIRVNGKINRALQFRRGVRSYAVSLRHDRFPPFRRTKRDA